MTRPVSLEEKEAGGKWKVLVIAPKKKLLLACMQWMPTAAVLFELDIKREAKCGAKRF